MTTLITADLHLTDSPSDSYRWDFLIWLNRIVKDHGVEVVHILGDLTEQKGGHSAELVNRVVTELATLAKKCLVVLLRGNHDGLTPACPFFGFVQNVPNIVWIGEPRRVGDQLFLPHTDDYERDWKHIRECGTYANTPWHFYHQTFTGAVDNDIRLPGIPMDVIPAGVRAYSGDIHKPQRLEAYGVLTYVGAPYTVRFGDEYEPRVLLLRGKKEISLPVPGVRKRKLEIENIDQLKSSMAEEGDLVKIYVKLAGKSNNWLEQRDQITHRATDEYGWKVRGIIPIFPTIKQQLKASRATTKSDEERVREFAKRHNIADALIKAGLEYL